MTESWSGPERRAENLRFDKAIADVRELKGATTDLAEAVKMKTETFHRLLVRVGIMLAALAVLILISNVFFVKGLNGHMDEGRDRVVCLLKVPAELRTPQYQEACGVK